MGSYGDAEIEVHRATVTQADLHYVVSVKSTPI